MTRLESGCGILPQFEADSAAGCRSYFSPPSESQVEPTQCYSALLPRIPDHPTKIDHAFKRFDLDHAVLWQRLLKATADHDIAWRWVRGHTGHPENERCDELAVAAASQKSNPPDEGYLPESIEGELF